MMDNLASEFKKMAWIQQSKHYYKTADFLLLKHEILFFFLYGTLLKPGHSSWIYHLSDLREWN